MAGLRGYKRQGLSMQPASEQDIFSYKPEAKTQGFHPASYAQEATQSLPGQFSDGSVAPPVPSGATGAGTGALSAGATAGLIGGGIALVGGIQQAEEARRNRALEALMRQRQGQMSAIESGSRSQERSLKAIQDIYSQGLA